MGAAAVCLVRRGPRSIVGIARPAYAKGKSLDAPQAPPGSHPVAGTNRDDWYDRAQEGLPR